MELPYLRFVRCVWFDNFCFLRCGTALLVELRCLPLLLCHNEHQLVQNSKCIFILFCSPLCLFMKLIPNTDWKSKSDECEKAIDELKEQNGSVADALAKMDRQVKSKVCFHQYF